VLRAPLVHRGEHVILGMWHDRLEGLARADLLASDDERSLDRLGLHLLQAKPKLLAFGRARCV
jgi:hypothetical protein